MFPLRDDNPTMHASVMTFIIIAVNVLVWVFVQHMGLDTGFIASVYRLGMIPGELLGRIAPGTEVVAGKGIHVVFDGIPNYFSLLTSMFAHGGWFHLISNMWFLVVFSDNVEDAMGPARFLIFYLLCGLAAAGAQILVNPSSAIPMVGASGAISGVLGAYALLYPRAPVHVLVFLGFFLTRVVVPAFFMLFYWLFLQILSGLPSLGQQAGGVAFFAHIGGFVAGLLLARLFCHPDRLASCRNKHGRTRRLISVGE